MACCRRARRKVHPEVRWESIASMGAEPTMRMQYPMYAVSVAAFLGMQRARPHQVLRAEGVAVEVAGQAEMVVTFVSHQWCGRCHPDPAFAQLRVLQGALSAAKDKKLTVAVDLFSRAAFGTKPSLKRRDFRDIVSGHIWYDYFCVPQPEAPQVHPEEMAGLEEGLGRAVASLAAYVECSRDFLVLAPFLTHESGKQVSYESWKSRGWCRFERLARVLSSAEEDTILLVTRPDNLLEVGVQEFIFDPVGCGHFSDDRDRLRLAPRARIMIEAKLARLLSAKKLHKYRILQAWRGCLLEGLHECSSEKGDDVSESELVSSFMETFLLSSPSAGVGGTYPLTLATMMGDVRLMQALIDRKARVDCAELADDAARMAMRGQQPKHFAMMYGHEGALALLLRNRADVNARDRRGTSLLCPRERPSIVRMAVEASADLTNRNIYGMSALDSAVMYGRCAVAEALLVAGHPYERSADGLNPLHIAVLYVAGEQMVQVLCKAGVSLDDRFQPRLGSPLWAFLACSNVLYRLGRRDYSTLVIYQATGATPLMFAMAYNNSAQAAILLQHGADAGARNSRGLTAEEIAHAVGWAPAAGPTLLDARCEHRDV